MEIHGSILDLVGDTPMVYLDRLRASVNGGKGARVAAKLEMFNPGSSVKDRIGLPMIRAGEKAGLLKPGGTIVEPTSGNTGLGLAMAATMLGYRMVCTLPEKVPKEKQDLLKAYGAEVIVCPTNVEADDPRSYYKQAERLRDEEGAYLPYQYYNEANPNAHLATTGPEIWRQTDGKVTHFVAGMGTGGTISGIGRHLHKQAAKLGRPIAVVGVDTIGSVYAEYHRSGRFPKDIHQYLIDGIGEDFMPTTVWWDEVDHVIPCTDEDAFLMQARLAREEAIFTGSSGGAAAHVALELAREAPKGSLVVTLLPDTGDRYLSKFNVEWMEAKGLTKAPAYLRAPRSAAKPAKPPAALLRSQPRMVKGEPKEPPAHLREETPGRAATTKPATSKQAGTSAKSSGAKAKATGKAAKRAGAGAKSRRA